MIKEFDMRVSPDQAKDDYDPSFILSMVLDIGEEMLSCGAEINRVEDSIFRMLAAYGYRKVNVFSIPEFISASFVDYKGSMLTESRRIYKSSNDFHRLEELNEISRHICAHRPTIKELWTKLESMEPVSYSNNKLVIALGYFMGGAGFTVFLGGNLLDSLAAGIVALIFMASARFSKIQNMNKIVFAAVSAFLGGFSAVLLCLWGVGDNLDKIMIGDIMLLIPGMALTTSIKDMMCGDIIAGLLRFIESIMVAGAIALGYAIPLYLFGGMLS